MADRPRNAGDEPPGPSDRARRDRSPADRPRGDAGHPLRAFFAIELSAPARAAAGTLVGALRARPGGDRVRWVREENLHVTLRFLGDVDAGRVPGLLREVDAHTAGIEPFELRLGAVHPFPSPRRPRVIVLDVLPPDPIRALAAAIERGVVAAGLPREERPFRAHLTLGRLRPRQRQRAPDVTAADTPDAEAFPVTEAVLFHSDLHARGARYTPLGHVLLRSAARQASPPNTREP